MTIGFGIRMSSSWLLKQQHQPSHMHHNEI